jgi:hypothetical protein
MKKLSLKQQYKSYQQSVYFVNKCIEKYPNIIQVQSIGKTWKNKDIVLAFVSLDVKETTRNLHSCIQVLFMPENG